MASIAIVVAVDGNIGGLPWLHLVPLDHDFVSYWCFQISVVSDAVTLFPTIKDYADRTIARGVCASGRKRCSLMS